MLPVTRVSPSQDTLPANFMPSPRGSSLVSARAYGGAAPVYDAEKIKGVPVGIQVVGRKWEEEKVLKMMRILDNALGERGFGMSG